VIAEGLIGTSALTAQAKTYIWTHNVLAAPPYPHTYPAVTWLPTAAEHQAQFSTDYTLTAASKYRKAGNDGQDLGAITGGITATAAPPPPRNVRIVR
jgi:hypothetical protein